MKRSIAELSSGFSNNMKQVEWQKVTEAVDVTSSAAQTLGELPKKMI